MDCSDDDDNEWVYPDMLSEEGNGVEETFPMMNIWSMINTMFLMGN